MISRATLSFLMLAVTSLPALAETKVAVIPIQAKTGIDPKSAELLTDIITNEISKRKDLQVIGNSELQSMVTLEQQKSLMGCADDSCMAEIGNALGVDKLVSGSVGKFGEATVLNLSLADMKNARVLSRATETVVGPAETLLPKIPGMVASMMEAIPKDPATAGTATASTTKDGGKTGAAATAGSTNSTGTKTGGEANAAGGTTGATAKPEEGEGGSSMPRRVAGGVVAAGGAVVLLLGLVAGVGSIVYGALGIFAVPSLKESLPTKYLGFAPAIAGDVLGIAGLIVLAIGVVVLAIP